MKLLNRILLAAVALIATACSQIDADDRYIELPPVEAQRVALLEEYTGQLCTNCPEAHSTVKTLLDEFGENLISVSIHCGGTAFAIDEPYGLATDLSQSLGDQAGAYALPCGIVNRGTEPIAPTAWKAEIRKAIEAPSPIVLSARRQIEGGIISVEIDMEPYDNFDASLLVWVVESGITALQRKEGNQIDPAYVHDHVLRTSANGRDGDQLKFVTRQPQTAAYEIKLQENWNPANLSLVAFVYNKKGVLQAIKF